MTEQQPKPGPHRWTKGQSGNPRGRVPLSASGGVTLADALRSRFPPERIAELVDKLVIEATSESVRLAALQLVAERTAGKVVSTVDLAVSSNSATPARDWSAVPLDERRALLERLRSLPTVDGVTAVSDESGHSPDESVSP